MKVLKIISDTLPTLWPTFVERYGEVTSPSSPSHSEGVVVAVLIALFFTSLISLFSPALRRTKVLNILVLRAGDNVKGESDTPGMGITTFFLVQGAFLLSILLEAAYADKVGYAVDYPSYWWRLLVLVGVIVGGFVISYLVYRWIGLVFAAKEEMKVWRVNYMTLLCLWALFLFIPVLMLVMDKLSHMICLAVALAGYLVFRMVLFVRIVQIFRFSFHHPLHLFLYLCGREFAPLLLILGVFL